MQLEPVTVNGKEYTFSYEVIKNDDSEKIKFHAHHDGETKTLKVKYTKQLVEALKEVRGLDVETELKDILYKEIIKELERLQ